MDKFWMVWTADSSTAIATHNTKVLAMTEAAELAVGHQGRTFYVLESLGGYQVANSIWTPHKPKKNND